jgi:hypothetical protein
MTEAVKLPDAWLRGAVEGVPGHLLPAAHAFRQAAEDVQKAVRDLPAGTLWVKPGGAASPGFHLKHLAGSTRRLLLYSRGGSLTDEMKKQMAAEGEADPSADPRELASAAVAVLEEAIDTLRATPVDRLLDAREVGKARLPTTVLGAIFHAAEHAQRHAGQFVTTVKVIRGLGLS